jgi:hypothetical protein
MLMTSSQKEFVEGLKADWKLLWQQKHNDRLRAEGIAVTDYASLFVERGTIIHATRDFKALNFKEILERHKVDNLDRIIQPNPELGGWNKFIKSEITNRKQKRNQRTTDYPYERRDAQQPKKGGRGWLHK